MKPRASHTESVPSISQVADGTGTYRTSQGEIDNIRRLLGTTKALKADAEHDRETDSHEESTWAALEETLTDRLAAAELSKEILDELSQYAVSQDPEEMRALFEKLASCKVENASTDSR